MIKVVIYDLDGTLWDHLDISSLSPPFTRVDRYTIMDSSGVEVRLYPDVPYVLSRLNELGLVISAASWNETQKGMMALDAFGLSRFFFEPQIEPHPNKHIMIRRIMGSLSKGGLDVSPQEVLYIDDRDIHIEDIWRYVGPVNFVRMWRDARSHIDILCMVKSSLKSKLH